MRKINTHTPRTTKRETEKSTYPSPFALLLLPLCERRVHRLIPRGQVDPTRPLHLDRIDSLHLVIVLIVLERKRDQK